MGELVHLAAVREARAAQAAPWGQWTEAYGRAYVKLWLERAMLIGWIADSRDEPHTYRKAARLLAWIWRERLRHPLILELAAEAACMYAERDRSRYQ